jgi:hypothetical protein
MPSFVDIAAARLYRWVFANAVTLAGAGICWWFVAIKMVLLRASIAYAAC